MVVCSSSTTVSSCVPQGTALGPLLFILYLSEVSGRISSQVHLLANDCILYREIHGLNYFHELQKDIDTLCNWESKCQMKLNNDKCCFMHVTCKRNPVLTNFKMNGGLLDIITSHTYLGIGMNNKLSNK